MLNWLDWIDLKNPDLKKIIKKEKKKLNENKEEEEIKIKIEKRKQKIIESRKKYYQKNKEKIKEYNKKYYQKNKEKKILCQVCNCYIRYDGLNRHKKSKKHLRNLDKRNF